ncbi:MAG TPA: low molecular weight protein-tyrosine-phosphatase [Propionicimonas sp.]|nr:low molecular weight protein-tyrosine-phosphatase [Propionicimonas sp.]HRA05242.1 low molecular weight protein-tyrosine-phosphatase [Propionicimonas sp.]
MSTPPEIAFVCWGNICRSPMAQVIAESYARREGLRGVTFTSYGVSSEEIGNPIDPRAADALRAAGFTPGTHTARRITPDEAHHAALLIGMEDLHLAKLRRLVPDAKNLYLLTDFDPNAIPGSGIDDPWYGDDEDFAKALREIEAAMPEVIKRARELIAG